MDGSTDAGNVEDELVLVQYCTQDDPAQEMRSCVRYLSLEVPVKADADGLIKCVGNSLQTLVVDNILDRLSVLGVKGKPILIGGGNRWRVSEHCRAQWDERKAAKTPPLAVLDVVLCSSP